VRFPRYDGYLDPPLRHPTQIYEALLGLCVFALLLWADRRLGKERRPRGALIALFLAAYFSGRFVVEFWKEVPPYETAWGLDAGQWLSIAPALAGWVGCIVSWRRRIPARWSTIANVSDAARKPVDSPQK
jgi:phosphatidylglycerol:prolipoprotein diacylglycerol transferase